MKKIVFCFMFLFVFIVVGCVPQTYKYRMTTRDSIVEARSQKAEERASIRLTKELHRLNRQDDKVLKRVRENNHIDEYR